MISQSLSMLSKLHRGFNVAEKLKDQLILNLGHVSFSDRLLTTGNISILEFSYFDVSFMQFYYVH